MSDAAQSRVGTRFGRYRLQRLLGRGGMGEVYEAQDTEKDRVVAVKLISEEFSQDPVFRKRMRREAHTAGRLQEPHVVPVHDYGEIDGQLYLEMRLIEGTDLSALLKRFGPLDPPRVVAIIRQVASALDAAHAAGVMHRDIKPENVLITRDDFAYLVDFGIANATTDEKLTQLGTAVGTWKYMAPERFSNAEVTYRADIYALACVLHECLTGVPPYRGSSTALVTAHLTEPIPKPSTQRPGIPKAFDAVIARGMAKNPDDRYASAGDLAMAAHQALSTPDQDQAATLLRRSQESVLPGGGSTVTLPTAAPPPSPTWNQPATARPPTPPRSQPPTAPPPTPPRNQPPTAPPPTPTWSQPRTAPPPTPPRSQPPTAPPPTPPRSQPPTAPPPTPPRNQPPTAPPPTPPWNQPQPQAPAKRWPTSRWIILGGAGLAVLITIVVAGVLIVWPSPPKPLPVVTTDRLDSILLNAAEVNDIMGATLQGPPEGAGKQPDEFTGKLSVPECLGALYGGMAPVYGPSGYTDMRYLVFKERQGPVTHIVAQTATLFPSADKAGAFVTSSATKWKACAGKTVTETESNGDKVKWSFRNLTGAPPRITLLTQQTNISEGWYCQHVLSAWSNVVMEVNACASSITDQGSRIADRMSAYAKM